MQSLFAKRFQGITAQIISDKLAVSCQEITIASRMTAVLFLRRSSANQNKRFFNKTIVFFIRKRNECNRVQQLARRSADNLH